MIHEGPNLHIGPNFGIRFTYIYVYRRYTSNISARYPTLQIAHRRTSECVHLSSLPHRCKRRSLGDRCALRRRMTTHSHENQLVPRNMYKAGCQPSPKPLFRCVEPLVRKQACRLEHRQGVWSAQHPPTHLRATFGHGGLLLLPVLQMKPLVPANRLILRVAVCHHERKAYRQSSGGLAQLAARFPSRAERQHDFFQYSLVVDPSACGGSEGRMVRKIVISAARFAAVMRPWILSLVRPLCLVRGNAGNTIGALREEGPSSVADDRFFHLYPIPGTCQGYWLCVVVAVAPSKSLLFVHCY